MCMYVFGDMRLYKKIFASNNSNKSCQTHTYIHTHVHVSETEKKSINLRNHKDTYTHTLKYKKITKKEIESKQNKHMKLMGQILNDYRILNSLGDFCIGIDGWMKPVDITNVFRPLKQNSIPTTKRRTNKNIK